MTAAPLRLTFHEHQRASVAEGCVSELSEGLIRKARNLIGELASRQNTQLFSLEGGYVTTRSHCGVLANKDIVVQVLPKLIAGEQPSGDFMLKNLTHMIAKTGLDTELPLTAEALGSTNADFLETIAWHFASALWKALQLMPLRQYREQVESLDFKRGRILVNETTRLSMQGRPQLHCRFDSYDQENYVNTVFAEVCRLLLPMCRLELTGARLRACLRELVAPPAAPLRLDLIETISLGRHWGPYLPPWALAKMILRRQSIAFGSSGDAAVSIEFDMNRVFEAYAASLVEDICATWSQTQVETQREVLIADGKSFGADTRVLQRESVPGYIDIDVSSPCRTSFVIDAKYKALGARDGASPADVYQVLTYAQYRTLESGRPFVPLLLYPRQSGRVASLHTSSITRGGWALGFVDFSTDLSRSEEVAQRSVRDAMELAEGQKKL